METAPASDKGLGLGLVFGVVGLLAALVMYAAGLAHAQLVSGWAFAAAMLAGSVLVAAVHLSA